MSHSIACKSLPGLIAVLGLVIATTALADTSLQPTLDNLFSASCLNDSQSAVSIVKLPDGKPVYQHNVDTALLPASIMKLITTGAALHYLGPEYRFQTDLLYTGQIQGSTLSGDLILRGGGDPALSPDKLWRIADQLRERGVRSVAGRLIADASFFDGYDRAPDWDDVRTQKVYDAKIGALSLNLNIIEVNMQGGAKEGDELKVWLEPAPSHVKIVNKARTTGKGGGQAWARRGGTADNPIIEINGKMPANSAPQVMYINMDNPARYTAESFRAALQRLGVEVQGATIIAATPPQATLLYRYKSPPLSWVLKELNTYSNNFIAEQVIKTVAAERAGIPGTHANAMRLVEDFLIETGVDMRGIHLSDASGLSRANRFTAHAMTDYLRAVLPRFDIGPDLLASLRVLGAEGAVSKRLNKSPARARVRAKTGTLAGVRNLAGYMSDASGQVYAYAFMFNQHSCGARGVDGLIDKVIAELYQQAPPQPARVANTATPLPWSAAQ
jgi:D-alanyl-D-alanine carboxypeptidase/D-alanyl-D-alanine-endopeptidase (penicillin-binding protein 4)